VRLQALLQRIEPARRGREREVDVGASLVAELLPARRPQAQAGVRPGRQPGPVVLPREDVESQRVRVKTLQPMAVARLQGELGEAVRQRVGHG